MPQTFSPSGYLPHANDEDDNSTGKKMAHEMRGVLLVILIFMLLEKHKTTLLDQVGEDALSKFIPLFELMIAFECWYFPPHRYAYFLLLPFLLPAF